MRINLDEDRSDHTQAQLPDTPALDTALDDAYDEYLVKWAREILAQARGETHEPK